MLRQDVRHLACLHRDEAVSKNVAVADATLLVASEMSAAP